LNDENYPEPECSFGVAMRRDILHIKKSLERIVEQQQAHTEKLQNGLTSKVEKVRNDVQELKQKREEDEDEEEEKQKREDRRDWEFKKMILTAVLGNIGALIVGLVIGYFGFA